MWFQTQKLKNTTSSSTQFVNTKILEIWQCKACLNMIYQHEYNFSLFAKQESKSYQTIALENVKIELFTNPQQKFMKIGYKDKRIQIKNQVKIYCKFCLNSQYLGEFKPEVDLKNIEFHYELVPKFDNIKVTKVIYGRVVKLEIEQQNENEPSIFPKSIHIHSTSHKRLQIITKQIQKYLLLWLSNKNIKIYYPFILESEKKRNRIQYMKQFIAKLMLKQGNIKVKLNNLLKASGSQGKSQQKHKKNKNQQVQI